MIPPPDGFLTWDEASAFTLAMMATTPCAHCCGGAGRYGCPGCGGKVCDACYQGGSCCPPRMAPGAHLPELEVKAELGPPVCHVEGCGRPGVHYTGGKHRCKDLSH